MITITRQDVNVLKRLMMIRTRTIDGTLKRKISYNASTNHSTTKAGYSSEKIHRSTKNFLQREISEKKSLKNFRFFNSSASVRDLLPSILEDKDLFKTNSYINGEWVEASSSKRFSVQNPATGEEIGTCADLDVNDLIKAIEKGNKAFSEFGSKTPNEISSLLKKFYELIKAHQDDLTRLIVAENGKSFSDAKAEVVYASTFLNWFSGEAIRSYGDIIPSSTEGVRHLVISQPIGLIAAICPWNFPAAMITRKISPALAAGCSVVVKAPAETPFTALALAELSHRAGFPPGVINVITSQSSIPEIGKELCENDLIKKLSFTGSTPVGKLLMKQSSSTLKKLSLELGGNAPFIVFDDADIDEAVKGAIACKFRGSGQTCVSANRFFVQSSIYAEFASKLTKKVSGLKVGSGFEEGVRIGPLINQKGLDKVEDHVNRARSAGAEILIGGKRLRLRSGVDNGLKKEEKDGKGEGGFFFEPTVLSEVPVGSIDQEETFGPVVSIYKFETENEVLRFANQSEVGLAGYFYSKDLSRIWRVAEKLEVGMVGINTGIISNATTPFGGIKHSGFGREGGKYGIKEFQYLKYIAMGGI